VTLTDLNRKMVFAPGTSLGKTWDWGKFAPRDWCLDKTLVDFLRTHRSNGWSIDQSKRILYSAVAKVVAVRRYARDMSRSLRSSASSELKSSMFMSSSTASLAAVMNTSASMYKDYYDLMCAIGQTYDHEIGV